VKAGLNSFEAFEGFEKVVDGHSDIAACEALGHNAGWPSIWNIFAYLLNSRQSLGLR
jgi:hypothetical protein